MAHHAEALDRGKLDAIRERFEATRPDEAYYLKDQAEWTRVGPLAPQTVDVLMQAFRGMGRVLDIGCGRGDSLVRGSGLFDFGVGLDQSANVMLTGARSRKLEADAASVHLVAGQPYPKLPFADEIFDFVFSERGPLGHSNPNLIEARRVLKPGGRVFYETGGDFPQLIVERERVERLGFEPELATYRAEQIRFADVYAWMWYTCSKRRYIGEPLPDDDAVRLVVKEQTDEKGRVEEPYTTIWIGARKPVGDHRWRPTVK